MSSASKSLKSLAGIGALVLGALAAAGPAGAQEPVPQCDGQDATIVFDDWNVDDLPEQTIQDEDHGEFIVRSLQGTNGDDVIVLGPQSDEDLSYEATSYDYAVLGLGGDDVICFSGVTPETIVRQTLVLGGPGNDTIFSMPDAFLPLTPIWGGEGDDILYGGTGTDVILGGPGDDQIFGYQGGRVGLNVLIGGAGNDIIRGGSDLDLIDGGGDDDTIYGAQDDDILYGGLGRDTIFGGAGDDTITSNDDFFGSTESGILRSSEPATPQPASFGPLIPSFSQDIAGSRMFGGTGDDVIIGSDRWDRMQGGAGDDLLLGMEGRDWIRGGAGNDIILGGTNIDDVNGNQGNDEIILHGQDIGQGGFGIDTCTTGLAGTANPTLRSCENTADIDVQWPALVERITDSESVAFREFAIE